MPLSAVSSLVLVWLYAVSLQGQLAPCAATPEAAAAGAFVTHDVSAYGTQAGYRVQDVQVDALTKHVWIRVRPCGSDAAPALLVPMQASLGSPVASPVAAGGAVVPQPILAQNGLPAVLLAAPVRVVAVNAGDEVRVIASGPAMQMEMEGRAAASAALGERLEVVLHRSPDESEHRIHGTLRANHTVEVQP